MTSADPHGTIRQVTVAAWLFSPQASDEPVTLLLLTWHDRSYYAPVGTPPPDADDPVPGIGWIPELKEPAL